MLETIRAYAAELEPDTALRELQARQLAWCLELAEGAGPRFWERGKPWLDRLTPELANVSAALDFARESDDLQAELRLVASMRYFWRVRGHGHEAGRRLEEAYERSTDVEPALRARVLYETGIGRMSAGDYEGARAAWLAARELYEAHGTTLDVARIHSELAGLSNASGDPEAGIRYGEVAAEMLQDEEFLLLIVLGNLAESYEQSGDLERARSMALQVLEGQRRIGDRDGVAYMSFALASTALAADDLPEAHRRLIECFTVAAELGFVELTGYALGVAAEVALRLDAAEPAAVLVEASRESFRRMGGAPQTHEAERQARIAAEVAQRLEDAEQAFARGRALRPDEAVELAISLDTRGT